MFLKTVYTILVSFEYARYEKHRFYRMAKRSATECAAILDIGQKLGLIEPQKLNDARSLRVPEVFLDKTSGMLPI